MFGGRENETENEAAFDTACGEYSLWSNRVLHKCLPLSERVRPAPVAVQFSMFSEELNAGRMLRAGGQQRNKGARALENEQPADERTGEQETCKTRSNRGETARQRSMRFRSLRQTDIAIAQVNDYVMLARFQILESEVLGKLYNDSAATVLETTRGRLV